MVRVSFAVADGTMSVVADKKNMPVFWTLSCPLPKFANMNAKPSIQTSEIPIDQLQTNTGQIKGVPKNPRFIKDYRFMQLVDSITEDPEMLQLRELIVFKQAEMFVVIGGNQRFEALKYLKYKSAPCKVIPPKMPVRKLCAIAIKDNVMYGQADWDSLANEWSESDLTHWGVEIFDAGTKFANQINENDEWKQMPGYMNNAKADPLTVVIHFGTQADKDEFSRITKIPLTDKSKYAYFPYRKKDDVKSLKFESDNTKS
jgi:hypothetical protein